MRAHQAPHQPLDAFRRHQAHLGFVQANGKRSRGIHAARHHPVVATQRQHAAAGRGMAGHRRHHRDA
jgi:hypothetical protein